MRTLKPVVRLACLALVALASASHASEEGGHAADWRTWHAGNQVDNVASLQRGARNFFGYCHGCHSLKYVRYSRMAEDLLIPPALLEKYLLPRGAKTTDYVLTSMPHTDAEQWFGKAPPDLTLMARARGTDYLYQFLKTFYVDPSKPTGVNNLRLEGTAMPHVLSELEGLKEVVYTNGAFQGFRQLAPGAMKPADYDAFVRDTVNFLDYASEPAQVARRALGVWVVLFVLVFTWLAYLLKKEYWKDVR
jgi:ubiquinol-cytochrome c reductase cytochrome c1 subunit